MKLLVKYQTENHQQFRIMEQAEYYDWLYKIQERIREEDGVKFCLFIDEETESRPYSNVRELMGDIEVIEIGRATSNMLEDLFPGSTFGTGIFTPVV